MNTVDNYQKLAAAPERLPPKCPSLSAKRAKLEVNQTLLLGIS